MNKTFDNPRTFQRVILRAEPEESHAEPVLQDFLTYTNAKRMPGDHKGLPYRFTYNFPLITYHLSLTTHNKKEPNVRDAVPYD